METPLLHRDGSGGLFIGTSMLLLALMNSAPAELLHLLVHAALQPLFGYLQIRQRTAFKSNNQKKRRQLNAGAGILFQKHRTVFRRKISLA
jgi:hypothetical protein